MAGQVDERSCGALSGWLALPLLLGLLAWTLWATAAPTTLPGGAPSVLAILCMPVPALLTKGFCVLEPNQAAVIMTVLVSDGETRPVVSVDHVPG